MMFRRAVAQSLEGTELKVLMLMFGEVCHSCTYLSYHENAFLTLAVKDVKSQDKQKE